MDVIWVFLSTKETGDGCKLKFSNLSKVAKLVLTLPHLNAGEERVFSLVRLNKTPYRSSLGLGGTLSSILTVKLHNQEPCYDHPLKCWKSPRIRRQLGNIISNIRRSEQFSSTN